MRRRRLAGATGWLVGLSVTAVVLQWAGHGALAAPPLTEPGRWAGWLGGRDPVLAAFSLLRVVALGGLWYLAGVTLLGAVVRLAGAGTLVRFTDRVTVAPVRRMLAGGVSLGLAASGVVTVGPALRAPVAAAQTPTPSTSTTVLPATVTMHRLGPAEPSRPAAVPVPDLGQVAPPATDRWTVKPGECFWSIAEDVLTARWGRPPTDAEIVPYWRRLIDANRHELAHRDNADLIFPAQVFVIPPP